MRGPVNKTTVRGAAVSHFLGDTSCWVCGLVGHVLTNYWTSENAALTEAAAPATPPCPMYGVNACEQCMLYCMMVSNGQACSLCCFAESRTDRGCHATMHRGKWLCHCCFFGRAWRRRAWRGRRGMPCRKRGVMRSAPGQQAAATAVPALGGAVEVLTVGVRLANISWI